MEARAIAKTKSKKRVIIVCSRCGAEVTCSPGMAKYALEGRGVCAREGCEGEFMPEEDRVDGSDENPTA